MGADGEVFRLRGTVFAAVLGPESLIGPGSVAMGLFEIGEGFMIHAFRGAVRLPDEAGSPDEAMRLAERRVYADRSHPVETEHPRAPVVAAVPPTPAETYDVAALAGELARRLGVPEEEVERVEAAAQLRDVGNMALPEGLVKEHGELGEDDRRFVELHTISGERLLCDGFAMHEVGAIVRSSHERWDGTGYPDHLAGEAIPLAARIVFVCSALQDMTSERPHRAAMSEEVALAELRRCAGTQFDPAVVAELPAALRAVAGPRVS